MMEPLSDDWQLQTFTEFPDEEFPQAENLDDTDETRFSPEPGKDAEDEDACLRLPATPRLDYPDSDETFFENTEDILRSAQVSQEMAGNTSSQQLNTSIFTHELDLGWSQSVDLMDKRDGGDSAVPAPEDLYLQLQDPVTQEYRFFRVPGGDGSNADTNILLTQSLGWGHSGEILDTKPHLTQDLGCGHGGEPPDTMSLFTQDLGWTQQDTPDLQCSPLWPPSHGDQEKMDEIVASLYNMSFNLGAEDADVIPTDMSRPVDSDQLPPPPPPASPPPPEQPSSPTFVTTPRYSRRRPRGRPRKDAPQASPLAAASCKRKRVPAAPAALCRRSMSGSQLSQSGSPSSASPRHKVRKITASAASGKFRKDRAAMTAVYSRLQDLRFLMRDILDGREAFPAPAEFEKMRLEVLEIISCLSLEANSESNRTAKNKLKKEQAKQAADKLLHQLQVLTGNQENYGTTEEFSENVPQDHEKCQVTESCASSAAFLTAEGAGQGGAGVTENTEEVPTISSSPNYDSPKRKKVRFCRKKAQKQSGLPRKIVNCNYQDDTKNVIGSCVPLNCNTLPRAEENLVINSSEKNLHQEDQSKINSFNVEDPPAFCGNSETDIGDKLVTESMVNTESVFTEEGNSEEKERTEMGIVKQTEYQNIVNFIRMNAGSALMSNSLISRRREEKTCEKEDYVWRGGPLKLTGILLPKKSEYEPHNLPPSFWDNPQAPIPQEWIDIIEWDD